MYLPLGSTDKELKIQTSVIWLKYCRYGVKHIQSISQFHIFSLSEKNQICMGYRSFIYDFHEIITEAHLGPIIFFFEIRYNEFLNSL